MKKLVLGILSVGVALSGLLQAQEDGSGKKIVFLSGKKSHGYGAHEFNAGNQLMDSMLKEKYPKLQTEVFLNGEWPKDPEKTFGDASSVIIFCNGGRGHMAIPHLKELDPYMEKGTGLACLHYAVEVPVGPPAKHMLKWMGGYFEAHWSVNPHWVAEFKLFPDHPITRGVKPFKANDEWYYHMRFVDDMKGVTPVLSAHPPKKTLERKDGPHSGNPHVRKAVENGEIQHLGWAYDRPDNGGRGFGFTGLHYHWNLENDDLRKLVLNAVLWVSKMEVPENGIQTETPSREALEANQDFPKPEKKKKAA